MQRSAAGPEGPAIAFPPRPTAAALLGAVLTEPGQPLSENGEGGRDLPATSSYG